MSAALKVSPSMSDHRIGYMDAAVIMVEYGDYECPYSRVVATLIDQLIEEFRNDLCYIYRHFPMKNIHPHSESASLAALSSGEQGKFWEMHRLLFQVDEELTSKTIGILAQRLNLDTDLFFQDMKRRDLLEKINQDFEGGIRSGVSGTPTFYLNGYHFDNSSSYGPLKEAIEEMIDIRREAFY